MGHVYDLTFGIKKHRTTTLIGYESLCYTQQHQIFLPVAEVRVFMALAAAQYGGR